MPHLSRVDLGLDANLFGNLDAVGLQNQPANKYENVLQIKSDQVSISYQNPMFTNWTGMLLNFLLNYAAASYNFIIIIIIIKLIIIIIIKL